MFTIIVVVVVELLALLSLGESLPHVPRSLSLAHVLLRQISRSLRHAVHLAHAFRYGCSKGEGKSSSTNSHGSFAPRSRDPCCVICDMYINPVTVFFLQEARASRPGPSSRRLFIKITLEHNGVVSAHQSCHTKACSFFKIKGW